MVISNRNQGANGRTWTVVIFFDLCVLDILHAGGLQRRIGRLRPQGCRYTYIAQVMRGNGVAECLEGDFRVSAGYEVVV